MSRPRIGVSACLLGEPVRFNAGHARDALVADLARDLDLVPFCPEMGAGLGAPRETIHLEGDLDALRVVSRSGRDVTAQVRGAAEAIAQRATTLGLDGVVLKKGSPTCGLMQVRRYPGGNAPPRRDAQGVLPAALAAAMPSLAMEEEGRLHDAELRDHFLERVHAAAGWRTFSAGAPDARALMEFHARHKMQLLAHHPANGKRLGQLASSGALAEYGRLFAESLARPATRGTHANVLEHLLGHAKGDPASADVARCIDEYRRGHVPLAVPVRVLLHHLARAGAVWALAQRYFEPYPRAMRTRAWM